MTIWHKNGTEDMTHWSVCCAPGPCICNTAWPDKEMCAGSAPQQRATAYLKGQDVPAGDRFTDSDIGALLDLIASLRKQVAALTAARSSPRISVIGETKATTRPEATP